MPTLIAMPSLCSWRDIWHEAAEGGGAGWGENGYGWLPYEYLVRGLAEDFWSVLKKEWVDTGEFS
jgi:hypothetical protein